MTSEKRTTLWRLNANRLKWNTKEELKTDIQRYFEENDHGEVSLPVLWDACKAVLRGTLIAKVSFLKKLRQKNLLFSWS